MDITTSRPGTNLRDSARDFVHSSPVSDSRPIPADEIVIGCVTEDTPKFLGQTLRLVQSIRWFGGELARARLVVGAGERIDPRARRALPAPRTHIPIGPPFTGRTRPAHPLPLFAQLPG